MSDKNLFNLIYQDPAWVYNARNNPNTKFGTGMHKYTGSTLDQLKAFELETVLDRNAAIVTWTVSPKLDQYFDYVKHMEQFGFRHVSKLFCWIKVDKTGNPRALTGHYSLSNTEDCFLMARGSMPVVKRGIRQVFAEEVSDSVLTEDIYTPVLKPHSTKPSVVKSKIVEMFGDVPRLELFARNVSKFQDGWVHCGNEVIGTEGMDIKDALSLIKTSSYL